MGLLIFSIVIVQFIVTRPPSRELREKHGNIIITRNKLQEISTIVQITIKEVGNNPPIEVHNLETLFEWLRLQDELFELTVEDFPLVFDADFVSSEGSRIYDGWGNPIQLIIWSNHEYMLLSYGPNETSNYGTNDDITLVFYPSVLIEDK